MHTLPKCTMAIRTSGNLMLLLLTDPGLSGEGVSTIGLLLPLLHCNCCCLQMLLRLSRGQILAHR